MASCQFFTDCSQNNEWPFKSEGKCKVVESVSMGAFLRTIPRKAFWNKIKKLTCASSLTLCNKSPAHYCLYLLCGSRIGQHSSGLSDSLSLRRQQWRQHLYQFCLGWRVKIKDYSFVYMQNDISDLSRPELIQILESSQKEQGRFDVFYSMVVYSQNDS